VATDDDAFADATIRALGDEGLAARLGEAGHRYVVEHHTWASVARQYEAVYREAVDARGR
jgi:glycosyltransferase involved in cell wall biosynthesis